MQVLPCYANQNSQRYSHSTKTLGDDQTLLQAMAMKVSFGKYGTWKELPVSISISDTIVKII